MYGSCLCDIQISYEMVSNGHVRQLTVSLQTYICCGPAPFVTPCLFCLKHEFFLQIIL